MVGAGGTIAACILRKRDRIVVLVAARLISEMRSVQ